MKARTVAVSSAAFVASAALAFAGATAISSASPARPAIVADDSPIIVPQVFAGDVDTAAKARAANITATHDAEAAGIAAVREAPHADTAEPRPAPRETQGTPATIPAGVGTPEPASEPTVEPIVVDPCASAAPPADCPDGIGGTVRLALDADPILDGLIAANPPATSAGLEAYEPTCAYASAGADAANIGVTVNRPATIEVSLVRIAGGTRVTRTITLTTSDQDDAWRAWQADPASAASDPAQWMHECAAFTDLAPGTYQATALLTDADDATNTRAIPVGVPVTVTVTDLAGRSFEQVQRPTVVAPVDGDAVIVNAVAESGQTLLELAVPAAADGTLPACSADLTDTGTWLARHARFGRVTSQERIAPDVLYADDYPYLPAQDTAITERIDLTEGTDYMLCLFTMDQRGGDGSRAPVTTESIPIGTPEGYRATLRLQGIYLDAAQVRGHALDTLEIRANQPGQTNNGQPRPCAWLDVGFTGTTAVLPASTTLCEDLTGNHGLAVNSGITLGMFMHADDDEFTTDPRVQLDLSCHGLCVERPDELAMVPLPALTHDHGLCGTGLFGGCPDHSSIGTAAVVIHYDLPPGNGRTAFFIGASHLEDTAPRPPDTYVTESHNIEDATVRSRLYSGDTAVFRIRLHADGPMRVLASVEAADATEDVCRVTAGSTSSTPASQQYVTLQPGADANVVRFPGLCAGHAYRLRLVGDAAQLPVWATSGWDPVPDIPFTTPAINATVQVSINAALATSGSRPITAYSDVWLASGAQHDPGTPLVFSLPDARRAQIEDQGWDFTSGSTACGATRRGTGYLPEYAGTVPIIQGEALRILVDVTVRDNASGAGVEPCVPQDGRYATQSVSLRATTTASQLVAGGAHLHGLLAGDTAVDATVTVR